jgi:arsenite oxidase small subunit
MKSKEQNGRRKTLKIIVGAGLLAILAIVANGLKIFTGNPEAAPTTTRTLAWPRLKVINAKSLEVLKPLRFQYPLDSTSNILVKLGMKAENGVGPDGDIVAFSNICQHQGFILDFLPPASITESRFGSTTTEYFPPMAICRNTCVSQPPCHGSEFDLSRNGKVIAEPAVYPIPRVLLEYDQASGEIYAVGMGPPTIYGHGPEGETDLAEVLKYDLQGGQVVTQITTY